MKRKTEISKLDFEKAIYFSRELAKKVEEQGFIPGGVIGIATGGVLPAQIISDYFNSPIVFIKVGRPMTSAKKYLSLNRLPESAKSFLRRIEMSFGLYRFMKNRLITAVYGEITKNKYIIVDDSLDTGKTVSAVLKYLEEQKGIRRKDVLIAVLTQIFDDANPQADCLIYRNINFSFPWSSDSCEYHKFIDFCKNKTNLDFSWL